MVQFTSRLKALRDKFNFALGNLAQKTPNSKDTIPIRPATNQVLCPQDTHNLEFKLHIEIIHMYNALQTGVSSARLVLHINLAAADFEYPRAD